MIDIYENLIEFFVYILIIYLFVQLSCKTNNKPSIDPKVETGTFLELKFDS